MLQEQRFERVGGNETIQTHVRVLAATNQDLPKLVAEGRFRKDLYYRLNAVTIQVPPLRDRMEDVAELAHYFLFRFNRELNLDLRAIAPESLELLQGHAWPGNVRELQGVIKQAMLNASGHLLLPEFLPEYLLTRPALAQPADTDQPFDLLALIEERLPSAGGRLYDEVLAAVERILFKRVLRDTHWHQSQASDMLGISRATLRHKLRTLGIAVERVLVDETLNNDGPSSKRATGSEEESDA